MFGEGGKVCEFNRVTLIRAIYKIQQKVKLLSAICISRKKQMIFFIVSAENNLYYASLVYLYTKA